MRCSTHLREDEFGFAPLVVAGIWVGTSWTQGRWGTPKMGYRAWGTGMMGNGWQTTPRGGAQSELRGNNVMPGQGEVKPLDEAKAAVECYLQGLGYTGLEVKEVIEFERNYYAIAAEKDTGIDALEVLVGKSTGAVGPGPNMMWNEVWHDGPGWPDEGLSRRGDDHYTPRG